ncbi:MAG TPA: HlyD family efflux transporter periplasmic adaptor subunit [Candidatus Paceibacterota bacterium]|nr:HlyD family efflux transporter periplasmic adaptor subunit [Candidatus Paceibacterota bacterium]
MQVLPKRLNGWKAIAGEMRSFRKRAAQALPRLGTYAYYAFVAAVGASLIWLASVFGSTSSFSEVRPALQASLGSFAAFFSGVPPQQQTAPVTVTAPGQAIALNELEIKSAVSGRVVSILAQGQSVEEGDIVARLNDAEARAELKSAEASLAAAQRTLEQARSGTAEASADSAELTAARDQAFTALSNTHVNLAWIMPTLTDVVNGRDVRQSVGNIYAYADMVSAQYPEISGPREAAADQVRRAKSSYEGIVQRYRAISRASSQAEMEGVIQGTYETLKVTADALKSVSDFLAIVREQFDEQGQPQLESMATHQGAISDALVTTNDSLDELANATENLRIAQSGPAQAAPDIGSLEVAVAEREAALAAARARVEAHTVKAPIAGTIASPVRSGNSVVPGEILATIMTKELAARIALSEADVGHVQEGDAVTVTFDGVDGVSLPGVVLAVDPVATVQDGVVRFYAIVSYQQHERVRPGMTVTARIE